MTALAQPTPEERLDHCEARIQVAAEGMRGALREIREERLYVVAGFETFDKYCEERWGLTRRHVDRLIVWDQVAEAVRPTGLPEPERESHVRPIADLPPLDQAHVWKEAAESAPEGKITATHVAETRERVLGTKPPATSREAHSRGVLHSSSSNEWYTPEDLLEDVREFFGGNIDLDPASCPEANEVVQAGTIFTKEDDGLAQEWFGRVWCNPPYGLNADRESNQGTWSASMLQRYRSEEIREGMLLVNSATGSRWFFPLWGFWVVFFYGRLRFRAPASSGKKDQPTHGNAMVYFGPRGEEFLEKFSTWGRVVPPLAELAGGVLEEEIDENQTDLEEWLDTKTVDEVVHGLLEGLPLCEFDERPPAEWPHGHTWVHAENIDDVTCPACLHACGIPIIEMPQPAEEAVAVPEGVCDICGRWLNAAAAYGLDHGESESSCKPCRALADPEFAAELANGPLSDEARELLEGSRREIPLPGRFERHSVLVLRQVFRVMHGGSLLGCSTKRDLVGGILTTLRARTR